MSTEPAPAPATDNEDHSKKVADHYNKLQEAGLAERTKSRIFYLRNFNNWMKSMLISDYLSKIRSEGHKPQNVLDLCSGKGGDLLKWKIGNINHLVCADIAGTSVEQCEVRYKEMQERNRNQRAPPDLFSAEFITADCTKERLQEKYKNPDTQFDLVSCQFSFHYSFESYEQADMMLKNACECLKPGGYFIGTTPNSNELIKRLRNTPKAEDMSFGNDVYKVTFCTETKDHIPIFGAKYDFHLEGVVDCPEFVVHFPALIKMAEKYDMELVDRTPFPQFYKDHFETNEGRGLIGRMQGLEPYPGGDDIDLMSTLESDYVTAKAEVDAAEANSDGRKPIKVGTLSLAEWQASTLYLVFAFRKRTTTESSVEAPQTSPLKRSRPDSGKPEDLSVKKVKTEPSSEQSSNT